MAETGLSIKRQLFVDFSGLVSLAIDSLIPGILGNGVVYYSQRYHWCMKSPNPFGRIEPRTCISIYLIEKFHNHERHDLAHNAL